MAVRWPVRVVVAGLCSALLSGASPSFADDARGRGWIGIAMAMTNSGQGVKVDHVVHGSPADKAGLLADDRITLVDGVVVTTSRDVVHALSLHAVGDAVTVTYTRGTATQPATVVLADFPSGDAMLRMDHVGSAAPAWSALEPGSGFPATVASLRGRVVLIDFWATWCGPCRDLAPVLSRWQTHYGAEGLTVVGVTTDPLFAAATFKERLDLHYPMASDPHGGTTQAYGVSALPTLYIVDKRGVVRDVAVGDDPEQEARVEALVRALLAEPTAKP